MQPEIALVGFNSFLFHEMRGRKAMRQRKPRTIQHPRIDQCFHCPYNLVYQFYEHAIVVPYGPSYETRTTFANLMAWCGLAKMPHGDAPSCTNYETCRTKAINFFVKPPLMEDDPILSPYLIAINTTWQHFTELTRSLPPRSHSLTGSREAKYTSLYMNIGAQVITVAQHWGELPDFKEALNQQGLTPFEQKTLQTFSDFGGSEVLRFHKEKIRREEEEREYYRRLSPPTPNLANWFPYNSEPYDDRLFLSTFVIDEADARVKRYEEYLRDHGETEWLEHFRDLEAQWFRDHFPRAGLAEEKRRKHHKESNSRKRRTEF
jgi:hypothetical protein